MSTYYYLECLAHTPPIVSTEESARKSSQISQIREDWEHREEIWWSYDSGLLTNVEFGSPRMATIHFMEHHKDCPVQIRSEYGEVYPIAAEDNDSLEKVTLTEQIEGALCQQRDSWLEGFQSGSNESWSPSSNLGPEGVGRIDIQAIAKIVAGVVDRAS